MPKSAAIDGNSRQRTYRDSLEKAFLTITFLFSNIKKTKRLPASGKISDNGQKRWAGHSPQALG